MVQHKSVWCHIADYDKEMRNALADGWNFMGATIKGTKAHLVFEKVWA